MNIIVVENGTVTNVFTEEGEDFIVLERKPALDWDVSRNRPDLREVQGQMIHEAEELAEVELRNGTVAKHKDLYAIGHRGNYYVGQEHKPENEKCLGDGIGMFELYGKPISPGTLLFQANLLTHLMSMHE